MHEEVAKYLEVASSIYVVETKARADISSPEVRAKAAASVQWCELRQPTR